MAVSDIVSGLGTRYGAVYVLDTNTGLPLPAASSATPYAGVQISHIKSANATDPAPRRIQHMGEDRAYAQDSLPGTELETFQFVSSAINFDLDAALEGALVRDYTVMKSRAANTDRKGNEPLVGAMFYRQALDTDETSSTFGKLRQWHTRIYPSARVSTVTPSFGEEAEDVTYEGTTTNVTNTLWGEMFTNAVWGVTQASHIENTVAYQPRMNFWRGNGTRTTFNLSVAPTSSSDILVWVAGTLVTPSAVNTAVANPGMTLTAAAGLDVLVAAVILTSNPD